MAEGDFQMLPERTLSEIVRTCGNGWMRRLDRVPVAPTHFVQRSRIENYAAVIEHAYAYLPQGHAMTKDRKDAIWRHVCTEVDLMAKRSEVV